MQFVARGLKYNSSLETLYLHENNLLDPLCVKYIVEALSKPKGQPKLTELNLQNCGLTKESIKYLVRLLTQKFKLHSLNLKSNGVCDESAQMLLGAIKANPTITKLKLDLNPVGTLVSSDIETVLAQNSHRVRNHSIPDYKHSIERVQRSNASSILESAQDFRVKEALMEMLPERSAKLLDAVTDPKRSAAFHRQNCSKTLTADQDERFALLG